MPVADIRGNLHGSADGRFVAPARPEASNVRGFGPSAVTATSPDFFFDTYVETQRATHALERARTQLAVKTDRADELALRIRSIVSTTNSPEYQDAAAVVADRHRDLNHVQLELQSRYQSCYESAGTGLGRLLAEDSLAAAKSERPELAGIMSLKVKHRGVGAAESQTAAALAKADPGIRVLEAAQRKLHREMTDAMTVKTDLERELNDGDAERGDMIRERWNVTEDTENLARETAAAERHLNQLVELRQLLGSDRAQIIDPMDGGDIPVHEAEDGSLNLAVWRDTGGAGGRWVQATGWATTPGNITIGARLTLADGTDVAYSVRSGDPKMPTGVRPAVAVLQPADGSRALGRQHGWHGLLASIDSTG